MITADGARSLKRLPIAKKALEGIKSLDLSVKSGIYDGFMWKVWHDDNLSGGHIRSPDGIFILCVTGGKANQFVCDSYSCAALPILPSSDGGGRHIMAPEFIPTDGSYAAAVGGATAAQTVEAISSKRPLCLPFAGEYVLASIVGNRGAYYDTVSVQITNCLSSGVDTLSAPGISEFIYTLYGTIIVPLQADVGFFQYLHWSDHLCRPFNVFQDFVVATRLTISIEDGYEAQQLTGRGIYADAPDQYWTLTAAAQYSTTGPTPHNIGTYASDVDGVTRGIAAHYTDFGYYPGFAFNTVSAETAEYRVTLSFFDISSGGSLVTTIGFDVLEPLLHQLMVSECPYIPTFTMSGPDVYDIADPGDQYIAGTQCAGMLGHILGGPAKGWFTGSRSTTFSDAFGVVYSWCRYTDPSAVQYGSVDADYPGRQKNGGFKFVTDTGFERVSLSMPSMVLNDPFIHPWLTLLTDTEYLCLALGDGFVAGVFVGSPFGGWEQVMLPDGATILAVRPTAPASSSSEFECLAVGRDGGEYFVYMLRNEVWSRMSKIPVDVADGTPDYATIWDVCPFGSADARQVFGIKQFPVAR